MQEEQLSGGRVSKVVRIGDTVRRTTGPWTPTIHRLLAHVRAKGLHWVPEPRGLDDSGREILSYIPGTIPHDQPGWMWTGRVLIDVAGAIDFDFCSPGSRIWGLAYTAYRFVPLMPGPDAGETVPGERSPFAGNRMQERLEKFLAVYGAYTAPSKAESASDPKP